VPDARHLEVACDVYAPCARGATINDATIPQLKCKAIAGCANNQLLEPRHADVLKQKGIVYAPDYVINAGGIINVSIELIPGGYNEPKALEKIDRIYENLRQVFQISREQKISTHNAAEKLAERRLAAARR
jgi:leucine dehydrogenase